MNAFLDTPEPNVDQEYYQIEEQYKALFGHTVPRAMSDNERLTEILDEAFHKPWEVYSPEEYKRQVTETIAEIQKITPEEEKKKMNKRMSLRVQATALYRKDRSGSKATRWRYYQAICYACDYLADNRNLQKVSNITPTHFREVERCERLQRFGKLLSSQKAGSGTK